MFAAKQEAELARVKEEEEDRSRVKEESVEESVEASTASGLPNEPAQHGGAG